MKAEKNVLTIVGWNTTVNTENIMKVEKTILEGRNTGFLLTRNLSRPRLWYIFFSCCDPRVGHQKEYFRRPKARTPC